MEQQSGEKIIEECFVAPPQGGTTSTTPTSLPLTYFDLLWLKVLPVERLFFYEFPNLTTISFFDTILPNLKHSLELTLQHFILLAGNITWPLHSHNPIINYVPGDAVPFTIAESNADFNNLCSNLCGAVELQHLIPGLNISHEQASVLALQVTVFPNFGFSIGITTHHAAMDGKSSTLFMKSWAQACAKLGESPSSPLHELLIPFYDRSVISDPTGISDVYVNWWSRMSGPNKRSLKTMEWFNAIQIKEVKGVFQLTPSHIQKLKQYAQSKLNVKVHLSTYSVTCAYVIACLAKAENPNTNRVVFAFSVDCRSRLEPPIQPTYFGNCIGSQVAVVDTMKLLGNDGFINALEGIIESLNGLNDAVLNGAKTWISKIMSFRDDKIFTVAGSPRFEVYSVDFGWGKPKKVDLVSIDKSGAFSLSENRDNNGGIEIGLTLNKREIEAFANHFAEALESFGCLGNACTIKKSNLVT